MTVRTLRIALAGNPNCGKTSLFNALTGGHQRVGNYPGVTVERRVGHFSHDERRYEVIDLPGTYSLASYSPEERVAQHELLRNAADVVAAVVDSTTLERSLVFVTQLLQLGIQPLLCLNMADEAHRSGQRLDLGLLERRLGFPVVETVGHKALGISELKGQLARLAERGIEPTPISLGALLDGAVAELSESLASCRTLPVRAHDWIACRLLVADQDVTRWVQKDGDAGPRAVAAAELQRKRLESSSGTDCALLLMQAYQAHVHGVLAQVVCQPGRADARRLSDAVDAVLVNRLAGLPIFLAIMFGVFWLTFRVGEIPMKAIERSCQALALWVSALWPLGSDSALRSLLVDGLIGGVGGVLVFLPNIILLFFCLSLLENSGYMARAAFLMDRLMHRFGLHGRSFLPLMTGFGCSIPGIMATRTLENEKDRLATMLVLPLMSCGARLAVWMLLVPAFFAPAYRAPVLFAIYLTGILLAFGLALLLRRSLLRGEDSPFVMELPPYRLPALRNVAGQLKERSWIYLRKAGTVILAFSIVLWALSSYPKPASYRLDAQIASGQVRVVPPQADTVEGSGAAAKRRLAQAIAAARASAPQGVEVIDASAAQLRRRAEAAKHSLTGHVGAALQPVFAPLGFDWHVGTAILGAFAAKEVFVAQLGILYSLDREAKGGADQLRSALRRDLTPLAGISLILFLLIATPCMATFAILRRETGGWRWPLLQFFGLTALGYLCSLLVYQLGGLVLG